MKFILFFLILSIQHSFAEYATTTYYSSSDCSDSPTYLVVTPLVCVNVNCTDLDGLHFMVTCSSGVPPIPAGFVTEWTYSDDSCSGNPTLITGYRSYCAPIVGGSYAYASCKGSDVAIHLDCNSTCSDCTTESFNASCIPYGGESVQIKCTKSIASTISSAAFSTVVIQVLAVFVAIRR